MKNSIWENGVAMPAFPSMTHNLKTDVLIIGGTSLVVYPAAGLIDYFRGSRLVLINKSATGRESRADLVITDPIGEVFSQIKVSEKK